MALPNTDPSLPDNPAPIFQDNNFVTGPQNRLNNQAIWGNLEYLDDLIAALETSLEAEIAALDAEVVKITGNQTVAGVKTFTNQSVFSAGLNIATGQATKLNSNFFIGNLDDGTPLYSKLLTGTISNGSFSINVNHGITNANTDRKIFMIQCFSAANGAWGSPSPDYFNLSVGNARVYTSNYTDTVIALVRASGSGDVDFQILVIYK